MTWCSLVTGVPVGRLEMFRTILKFPCGGLPRIQRYGPSRSYLERRYSQSKCPEPPKKRSIGGRATGFYYTVGTLTLLTGGTVAYAKYDPDFREWLAMQAPWTDHLLSFLYQEEKTWTEQFNDGRRKVKSQAWKVLFGKEAAIKYEKQMKEQDAICQDIQEKEYKPPRSVFSSLLNIPSETPEKTWTEIRVIPVPTQEVPNPRPKIVAVTGEKEEKVEELSELPVTHPRSLVDLEQKIAESSSLAIAAYSEAICALREHTQDVYKLVEDSVHRVDEKIWNNLKIKTEKKERLLREAEEKAKFAVQNVKKMKEIIESKHFDAPEGLKASAGRNIHRVLEEIDDAETELRQEKKKAAITDKYWKRVEEARKHYTDELEVLFPNIRISDREWNIAPADLDLFILHCFQNIMYYQKELKKLEMLGDQRIRDAINASAEGVDDKLIRTAIDAELEKDRRALTLEFQKKILSLKTENEKEMRTQLKRQAEAHTDHLLDAVALRERELEREFLQMQDEKIAMEQAKFKYQLAGMMGRLKGLESSLKARANADKNAHQAQLLWSACQALHSSLSYSVPDVPWEQQLRPLDTEIHSIKKAALGEDVMVDSIIEGIPQEAVSRGVYNEDALRERFLVVEKTARRIALVPDSGASLPIFFLSYLQSLLLVSAVNPISQAELADEPVDFGSMDTYDILLRSRYWVDRGNFEQALRYMNLLKGASRSAARDWMNETRILLETQQAANALMVHAGATGLLFI